MDNYYSFISTGRPAEAAEPSEEAKSFIAAKDPAFAVAQKWALQAALSGDLRALNEIRRMRRLPGADLSEIDASEVFIGAEGALRVKIYAPKAPMRRGAALLLYIHGGGWTINAPETADRFCRDFALKNGAVVASPDYRLAPEHPYPAADEDVIAAYEWLCASAKKLGAENAPIFLCGDSAGGHLAIAAALALKSRPKTRQPDGVIAIYPAADFTNFSTPSYKLFGENYCLDSDAMRLFAASYAPNAESARRATLLGKNFAGMPRALILVSECDVLRSEGEALYAELAAAGVKTRLVCLKGATHVYITQRGMEEAYGAALAEASQFIACK